VYPAPWRDEPAAVLAAQKGAQLAVGRRQVTATRPRSLSAAVLRAVDLPSKLVLPSPNGSAIASGQEDVTVAAACLRNAHAVAGWAPRRLAEGRGVCVIAAGESWPDRSLRPALEDALGAGAVITALTRIRPDMPASVHISPHLGPVPELASWPALRIANQPHRKEWRPWLR
jgi:2-phosphosulfolactate phosphatase